MLDVLQKIIVVWLGHTQTQLKVLLLTVFGAWHGLRGNLSHEVRKVVLSGISKDKECSTVSKEIYVYCQIHFFSLV